MNFLRAFSLFIEFMSKKDFPSWYGYVLAVSLFLVTIIAPLFREQYQRKCFLCGIRIRSALVWAIYRKVISIAHAIIINIFVSYIYPFKIDHFSYN